MGGEMIALSIFIATLCRKFLKVVLFFCEDLVQFCSSSGKTIEAVKNKETVTNESVFLRSPSELPQRQTAGCVTSSWRSGVSLHLHPHVPSLCVY